MSKKRSVIIIGGGFAGLSAGRALRRSDCQVTLIDKTNHHLFQPLLYQVATAGLSPGDIAFPIREIFGDQPHIRVWMAKVTSIQKEGGRVVLEDGRDLAFDYLVVAPGAQYNYFGHKEWQSVAPGLKTIPNALDIRERLLLSLEEAEKTESPDERLPFLTFVVVGGGPTGVEMAGAIAEIAKQSMMGDYRSFSRDETQIYLIEAASRLLAGYPEPLSSKARQILENMGVQVLLNAPVTNFEAGKVTYQGGSIETPNLIWAAGVKAASLVESLEVEQARDGRVKVQKDLSLPGYPNIFVIGDAAYLEDEEGQALPALAPVALQQGHYVGELIRHRIEPEARKPFHYVDKGSLAAIGRRKAVASIRGLNFSGFVAWILWTLVHIYFLIGVRNRIRVFLEWMWYYITFRRGVRLITRRSR